MESTESPFSAISIPYAAWNKDDGYKTRSCPECGERFSETADEYGESTSNNYGKHYDATHRKS